jgi:hypothetical protein
MTNAYLLGFIHGCTGKEMESNPYRRDSVEYDEYFNGWIAGTYPT